MTDTYPDRTNENDENLWLEDIYGEKPLAWVKEQNARTMATFDAAELETTRKRILEVYDSDDRIPMLSKHGEWFYNFWQDAEHPRGIWRRTTLESYRSEQPEWELILDVDALGAAEGKQWVWQGAQLCAPTYSRALLRLSPDGGDAVNIREFDVESKAFVDDGFELEYAKSRTDWIDENTIYVATDFGEGSLTMSGYPRIAKRWQRDTPLSEAELVHEVPKDHMSIGIYYDQAEGFERGIVVDVIDFFNYRYHLVQGTDVVPVDLPTDIDVDLHREWLTVQPKSDWAPGETTYRAGSLLATKLDAFLAGDRNFDVVFTPDAQTSLTRSSWTRNHLLLNKLKDVSSRITIATPGEDGWTYEDLETPSLQNTSVYAVDDEDSDDYWMISTGYLQPSTLSIGTIGGGEPTPLKSMPALFDTEGLEVQQHFVTSEDGTRIPYFQISKQGLTLDGSNPTILYGYGGFEVSLQPGYDAATGRAWLENGGVYVVANIRGGGEYGPTWHTSALKHNRHRAYEDFSAVARDLIDRGVATPEHLGCMGGSNGGLLVGNMLTHYPELFGAIVCTVPLLDMKRYVHLNAGASWIAEYGDPEKPEEWEFIQTFSPYHNLREGVDYPAVLFYTATSDDRVGPVQARKMAARMIDRDIPNVWFYENLQGGHGGAADNSERAAMRAMCLQFLQRELA